MSVSEKLPAGFLGCGNDAPEETWKASTPASLEPLADLDRLRERVALLLPREERVVVVDRADLELEVEVVPDLRADGAHDLEREPGPVLERAAVLVLCGR